MDLETAIEQTAQEIEATGSDFDRARELYEQQQAQEEELEAAMARWETLSLLVESLDQG